jgi:hypothetical protein
MMQLAVGDVSERIDRHGKIAKAATRRPAWEDE